MSAAVGAQLHQRCPDERVTHRNGYREQLLSTTAAADADEVASIAREAGFDVRADDFVAHASGALVEYVEEDWFLNPRWWELTA